MSASLNQDGECTEDRHIEAELCDRRMTEKRSEPTQVHERPENEDDAECHQRVAEEWRDENAPDHQLGEFVDHGVNPIVGVMPDGSTVIREAATNSAALVSIASAVSAAG